MGFATILALLAFFIAMVALWLTSDVAKKVESQNEKFVRAHIAALRENLRDMDKDITKTSRLAKSFEEGQSALDQRLNDQTKLLLSLKGRLAQLSEQLEELDQSIPARYRVRPAKTEDKSDSKPSLQ